MKIARRFEIWSNYQAAGGTREAVLPDVLAASERRAVARGDELTLTIPVTTPAAAFLVERRVLRVDYSDSEFDEWRILDLEEKDDPAGPLFELRAVGIATDILGAYFISRKEADGSRVYDFEAVGLTPTQQIDNFAIQSLTDDGVTWIARGTVDPTARVDLTYSWDSILAAMDRLAGSVEGGAEWRLRRNGTTQYLLDLVTQVGAGSATLDVRFGKNLRGIRRKSTSVDLATRVVPRGASEDGIFATIAGAVWKVSALSGTQVTLADPSGLAGPVAFDDQFNGLYLERADGSLVQITDTVLASQRVDVAAAGTLAVNQLIKIRADSAGAALTWLPSPGAVTTYGRVYRYIDRPDIPDAANLIANPLLRDYAGASSPADGYTSVGVTAPTFTRTSAAGRWRAGGFSTRVQTTADGQGVDSPYASIVPVVGRPDFSGFVAFWLEAGRVRVELIAAKDAASVTSITRSGDTATVTYGAAHGLTSGDTVEILGASPAEYNGIWRITVVSSTVVTYQVPGTPSTPATGTITGARAWRFPDGTQDPAFTTSTKTWTELGPGGLDLYAIGATRVKLRIVQDGAGTADFYADTFQVTQTGAQVPLVEGYGPNLLWRAGNEFLTTQGGAAPSVQYDTDWLDLQAIDPATWPNETLTLGGPIRVRDEILNRTVSTRILEYSRGLTPEIAALVKLSLSNKPKDLTDLLFRPRRPRRPDRDAVESPRLFVSPYFTPVPGSPGNLTVRLAVAPEGATIHYWIGLLGESPPPISATAAGVSTSTTWGTYESEFTVQQDQAADLVLAVFARFGTLTGNVQTWTIDRDAAPEVALVLSEDSANSWLASWSPDDDAKRIRLYVRSGTTPNWPTTTVALSGITRSGGTATATTVEPHGLASGEKVRVSGCTQTEYNIWATITVTGDFTFTYAVSGTPATPATGSPVYSSRNTPLDESYFVAEKHVAADGGGFDIAGANLGGGTSYDYTGAAITTGDTVIGIAVPIDRLGNVGARASASLVIAGAPTPTVSFGAHQPTRLDDGSACNITSGIQVKIDWTPSALDDTYFLEVLYGEGGAGTQLFLEGSPNSVNTRTERIPYKRTSGKFDRTAVVNFAYVLYDSGMTPVQSGALSDLEFTTSCGGGA